MYSLHKISASRLPLRRGIVVKAMIAVLLCIGLTIPVVSFSVDQDLPEIPDDGFGRVTQGPMELVITQTGEVTSADNKFLINRCEWSTRLLSIVPEGTFVEEGDIVAELDSSDLEERFNSRAVSLVNAEANLKDAQEDLRIQSLTNQGLLADAELQVRLTQLQLDGYKSVESPQKRHKLEAAAALAEEALTRSRKQLEYVSDMVRSGYRTVADREDAKIDVRRKEQAYQSAVDRLNVLNNFTHERTLTQLTAIAAEAKRELGRVKLASNASILSRKVKLASRQRTYNIYKAYQDRLQKNIAACTIRATRSGEIIYAGERSSSSNRISEGSSMRYLQPVAIIPDRDHLQVKVRIHESNIRLIQKGLSANVEIESADTGKYYPGHISAISRVPMPGRYPNYHLREYSVTVDLDADSETARKLAPGTTAKVNLIAAQRPSTLRVPNHSVTEIANQHFVFVKQGDAVVHKEVTIGIRSDAYIEIIDGVEEGDQIVLKPRVTCAQQLITLHDQLTRAQSEKVLAAAIN